jgi:tetrahydromethanopterin S-methyltransferase subunit D
MKIGFYCASALSLLVCSACTTSSYLSGKQAELYANSFKLSAETATAMGWGSVDLSAQTAIVMASSNPAAERAVLLALINASDTSCERYMAGMITSSNTLKSVLGVSSLGLSSAASLSAPTRSANILSGVAGFATGTDQQLSNTLLGGKSTALIYKAVSAARKKERSRIMGIYESGNFALASAELADYHALCGPTVGVNALEEAVEKANSDAAADGADEGMKVIEQYKANAVSLSQ